MDLFQGLAQGAQQTAPRRRTFAGPTVSASQVPGDLELNAPAASAAIAEIGRVAAGKAFAPPAPNPEPRPPQAMLEYVAAFMVAAPHAYDAIVAPAAVQCQNPQSCLRHPSGCRLVKAVAGKMQRGVAARLQADESVKSMASAGKGRGQDVRAWLDTAPVGGHDEKPGRSPADGHPVIAAPLRMRFEFVKRSEGHGRCPFTSPGRSVAAPRFQVAPGKLARSASSMAASTS